DDLREAQERLKDMAHLIERTYEPEFITSNIYLALYISDCYRDYGFIYSFWLFPYERLNGYIENRKTMPFKTIKNLFSWSKQKLLSLRTINKETETTRKVEIEEGDFEQRPNTLQKNI
ncbi:11585_t:CDS:2, partial [Rhizophagus irregularis]